MLNVFRAALGTALLCATLPAMAITVVVDTEVAGDDCSTGHAAGSCSLRTAIGEVNAADPGTVHEIRFAEGVTDVTVQNPDLPDIVVPLRVIGPVNIECGESGFPPDAPAGFAFTTAASDGYLVQDVTLTGCQTDNARGGAGIYFNPANGPAILTVSGVTIEGTEATSGPGGAIKIAAGHTAIISDSRIENAEAGTYGGAIDSQGHLTLTDSTLTGNSVTTSMFEASDGAGAALSSRLGTEGSTLLDNVSITNNNAGSDNGGGVYAEVVLSALSFEIRNSTISGNQAANGAGLSVGLNGPVVITNSTFADNTSSESGGAIYLDAVESKSAWIRASNCTLSGNNAADGAALAADPSVDKASSMVNCTLAFNGADGGEGSGIDMPGTQLEKVFPGNTAFPFGKNLLVGNLPQNCTGLFDHLNDTLNSGSNVATDMSCGFTQGTDLQLGGVDAAMLAPTLSDNGGVTQTHRLLVGSPAIDRGNNIGTIGDQRGAPNADGLNDGNDSVIRDAGAYEFAGYSAVEFVDPSLAVDEDDTPLQFNLQRYGDITRALTGVTVSTEDASAEAGSDYDATPTPTMLSFAAGVSESERVTVDIDNDNEEEGEENFLLRIGGVTDWDLGAQQPANVTINDVEVGTVEFAFDDSEGPLVVAEDAGTLVVTLTRTGGTDKEVAVVVNSTDGVGDNGASSVDGEDYVAIEELTVTFPDGVDQRTFEVTIVDDNAYDPNNITFNLALTLAPDQPANFALGDNSVLDVAIDSEDAAMAGEFSLLEATVDVTEGVDAEAVFTVTRATGTDCTVTVAYSTTNGTADAGSDYTATNGELIFQDGDDADQMISIAIADDTTREGDERFTLTLNSATVSNCETGATANLVDPSTGTVTIRSDELVRFSFEQNAWAANEADGSVQISVRPLDPVTGDDVVVSYASSDGSAVAPDDYTATTGSLTWVDGEGIDTIKSFTIPLVADDDAEGSEGFSITLTAESAYAEISGTNPTPVTIEDRLGIRFAETSFVSDRENGGTITAVVERVGALDQAAQVDITTAELTPASALSDTDYQAKTEVVTWVAGDGDPKTVTFNVIADTDVEGDEQFQLVLENAVNAILVEPSQATATITDDDSEIMLDAATYAVLEADGVVTASLTRVGSFGAATVDYATADDSATAGTDYTAATGSVSWADGESGPKTVTVAVLNNDVPEASRSFSLSLSNPTPSADVQLGEQTTSTLTIGDDDSIIAMDAATLTVAEDGASVTVSASRTGTALGAATVTIATADGTAIAPADYEATTSTLSWADGETGPKSIAVPIIDDQDIADDIAFSVSLSEATPSSRNHFGAQTSTDVTITDNDSIITLDVAEAAAIESDGSIVVSATRSGTFGAASVNYTTADGSAQAGTHYAAASGSFQWADGEAGTQSVTITLTNDTDVNADRSFSLTIDTPTPADDVQLGDITTTAVTITNDDSTVSLTAATQSAPEAEGQIVFIAERTGDFGAASVDYATTDGSATAPADYTAASGTLTWAEGETGQKMVTVSITDNDTVEADRDFSLTLSNPDPSARVALGAITSATATILDDDTIITLDAATASAVEDDGSVTLTATRSGARGTATVTVRTADGTAAAGSHYTAIDSTLSWADGEEGSKSIVVNIADDLVVNDDRGFSVAISNPMPAALVRIGAISESNVTVVNNDSSVAMVLATQTSTEADGSVIVQVTRVGGFGAASIDYSTADGSAQAGTHYTATAGTLSWADGQTGTMEITVPVLDDAQVNADRTFDVTLANPTPANRVILDAQATTTVTVQSDDSVIAMDAPTTSAEEGDGSVTISATRSGASVGMASVLVMTSDGSAIAPDHYASYSERLSWADGESGSKSVTISLQDDSTVNDDRTFSVGLSDPAPAASVSIDAADSTTVTIVDDETVVALDAETYTVVEGGTVTVVASRSGSDSGAASVMYTTIDGTANSGTHYAATSGTLTWADGETGSKQFDITVTDDSTLNAARQFTVELSQPDPAARVLLGEPQTATVTIEDNETQVRFATEAYVASEGDGSTSLIVQRIGMGMGVVTVDYAVSGGSAVRGSDYSLADGTITWANGDTSDKAINVTLNDDTVAERTETVVISLSNVTSTGEETPLGAPASAALSIEDDDEAGFIFDGTSGSTTITEGGNAATASVVLSSRPTGNVTVSFDTPARVTVRTANPADNSRLVFTPSNWNVSQTVELLAVDDSAEQETVTQTITARTQSTDANYDDLSDSLQVTIIDNDGNQGGGGGGSGALGGGLLIVLGGLAALRRRRLTH